MNTKHIDMFSMIIVIILLIMVGSVTHTSHNTLKDKIDQQNSRLSDFREWKGRYTALLPIKEEWDKSFPYFRDIGDIYSLHQILTEDAQIDPDTLIVDTITRIMFEETKELGLTKICLNTANQQGTKIQAANVEGLVDAVTRLGKRPYIEMGNVKMLKDKNEPYVLVQKLCVLLRD